MCQNVSNIVVCGSDETAQSIERCLKEAGYVVHVVFDTNEALAVVKSEVVGLVIVEVLEADGEFLRFVSTLKAISNTPLLAVVNGDDLTLERCLEMGADDVIRAPLSLRELRCRVRLREQAHSSGREMGTLVINSLQIDPRRRQAFVAGELVPLRERELDLLIFLAAHPGTVFTKEQLLAEVWGSCREWQTPRTVTEHVYRLRKRLGTEIGVAVLSHGRRGYSFQPSVVEAVG